MTMDSLTLDQVLALIERRGYRHHAGALPVYSVVVLFGDNVTPPAFIKPQADGTFARRDVLKAVRAN